MNHRIPRRPALLVTLAVAAMVMAVGCGGGPEFTPDDAVALISAQWPEAELEMRNAYVDEEGRGVAFASFDGEPWEFYFRPVEGGGWALDAVSVDGSLHYLRDLENTSATMFLMDEAAGALARYKSDNGSYPAGDSPEALAVLIPDYIPEETARHDAWEQDFLYRSDGNDYTLISIGADGQEGTRDDIFLFNGEFVGANAREGQGQ